MKTISRNIISWNLIFLIFFSISCVYAISNYPNEEDYKISTDVPPSPVGGLETIMRKIVYPDMAIKTRVEGKVYVLIYVNESGDVDDVKIVKGIGAGCDEEAMKIIKKTKFSPASQGGAKIKAKFALALSFKLPN